LGKKVKKKLEVRCSNTVMTKSGREIQCGSFLFEWFKGVFSTPCRKCGTMYYASPKADGTLEVHGVPNGETILASTSNKES
jgi:hypothetical protein